MVQVQVLLAHQQQVVLLVQLVIQLVLRVLVEQLVFAQVVFVNQSLFQNLFQIGFLELDSELLNSYRLLLLEVLADSERLIAAETGIWVEHVALLVGDYSVGLVVAALLVDVAQVDGVLAQLVVELNEKKDFVV